MLRVGNVLIALEDELLVENLEFERRNIELKVLHEKIQRGQIPVYDDDVPNYLICFLHA